MNFWKTQGREEDVSRKAVLGDHDFSSKTNKKKYALEITVAVLSAAPFLTRA